MKKLLIGLVFLFSCLTNEVIPEYISEIGYDGYTYKPVSISEGEVVQDTLDFVTFYDEDYGTANSPILKFIADIEKVGDTFWVLDAISGSIHSYTEGGDYIRTISQKGRGPNELQSPSSLNIFENSDGTDTIIVLDPGLRSIIYYNEAGVETKRIISQLINGDYFAFQSAEGHNRTFFIQQSPFEDSLLVQVDIDGTFIKKAVPRITPRTDSYITHNHLVFDYDSTRNQLAYGFKGLPLLYVSSDKKYSVYNLLPNSQLTDFNKPFEKKISEPVSGNVDDLVGKGVKTILQDLQLVNNIVFFTFQKDLYSMDLSSGRVTRFVLVDSYGQAIKGYSKIKIIDNELFLINSIKGKIFRRSVL